MVWVRMSDAAAYQDEVLELAGVPGADERTLNEAFGFYARAYARTAASLTDGRLSLTVAENLAGDRTEALVDALREVGLIEDATDDKGRPCFQLTEVEDLFTARQRDRVEWERQRRRDAANPELTVPVRHRDGDACRYCARVVVWGGTTPSALSGTLDHREPGDAGAPESVVVACLSCNAKRRHNPDTMQLLDPPAAPYYSPGTARWLRGQAYARDNGLTATARRGRPLAPGTIPPGHDLPEEAPQLGLNTDLNRIKSGSNSELDPNIRRNKYYFPSDPHPSRTAQTHQSGDDSVGMGTARAGYGPGTGRERPTGGADPAPDSEPPAGTGPAPPRKRSGRRRGRRGKSPRASPPPAAGHAPDSTTNHPTEKGSHP